MASKIYSKTKLIDALNRMDEWASAYTVDNNEYGDNGIGEAEQLTKDYTMLYDFLMEHTEKGKRP